MSYIYNKDQVKLKALEYAEKNKIVNQKSINAFIAGFNFRDSHNSIPTLIIYLMYLKIILTRGRMIVVMGIIEEKCLTEEENKG